MYKIIDEINKAVEKFKSISSENQLIRIITHHDTDGITSGSILSKALQREDFCFRISVVKQLEEDTIEMLKKEKNQIVFILDLSGKFNLFKDVNSKIFVLDHHELINKEIPENIIIVNPFIEEGNKEDEICGAGLTYLFAKALNEKNKDLSQLAVLGMVGDVLGGTLSKINNMILKDSQCIIKKGLPLLAANRPIYKSLEWSSNMFIPGVTGSASGALELLREAGINDHRDRTLLDLNDQELSKLVTSIVLRRVNNNKDYDVDAESILENIYLLKFFGRVEDCRGLGALVNSCGKMGRGEMALAFFLGSGKERVQAEEIYQEYKRYLIKGLNYIKNSPPNDPNKKVGENYFIINCKDEIKDTVIGTALSILTLNSYFPPGNIVIGMAYRKDGKIKVSSRISKNRKEKQNKINLKEILHKVCLRAEIGLGGEVGGHANAAGCLIPVINEDSFMNALEKELKKV